MIFNIVNNINLFNDLLLSIVALSQIINQWDWLA